MNLLKKKYNEDYRKASGEHQDESLKLDEKCVNMVARHDDAKVGPETEAKLKKLSELIEDYFLGAFSDEVCIKDDVSYLLDNKGGLILSYDFERTVIQDKWDGALSSYDKKIADYVKEAFPGMEEDFSVRAGFEWEQPITRGISVWIRYLPEFADAYVFATKYIFGISPIDRKNKDTWYDFTK